MKTISIDLTSTIRGCTHHPKNTVERIMSCFPFELLDIFIGIKTDLSALVLECSSHTNAAKSIADSTKSTYMYGVAQPRGAEGALLEKKIRKCHDQLYCVYSRNAKCQQSHTCHAQNYASKVYSARIAFRSGNIW